MSLRQLQVQTSIPEIAADFDRARTGDLQRVRRTRLSPESWVEVLEAMLNEGAPLSEKDFPVVLRYLARNFKP